MLRDYRYDIRSLIDADNPSISKNTKDRPSGKSIPVIFWCTIAANSIISIPILIKAYQYSPHQRGTTKDADFWLLIQSGGMQVLNLVTAFIPTYKDRRLSAYTRRWMLAVLVLGLFCVIGAIILYTQAPAEWSAMLNCVAPIIQAFVLVQALIEEKGKKE